jgi:hypothetical protein
MVVYACVHVHWHVSGFTVPGSLRVCGGLVAPSPTRGSLRQPDRSAIVPLGLQDLSRLVVDTPPTQSNPLAQAPASPSTGPYLTIVFLTFNELAQGGRGGGSVRILGHFELEVVLAHSPALL